MILGLHHIAIICSDKNSALHFYKDTLGFEIREQHLRIERHDEVILLDGYGITLELFISKDNPPRVTNPEAFGLRHLALKVSNIEKIIEKIKEKGYSPEPVRTDSFNGLKMTFVKDPDGLPIELHE